MDKLTILMQQVLDLIGRGPRLPDSYMGDLPLTMEEPEAGKYLTWNLTLDGIINANAPSVTIPQNNEATAAAMVANTDLVAGDLVRTYGYTSRKGLGAAWYLKIALGDMPRSFVLHADHVCVDGLIAMLLLENEA
ncbi:MAG: hypothetical protein GY928_06390, partial [Colwellia sp.]|nr:hypothetical protein [Colwellia sp.]